METVNNIIEKKNNPNLEHTLTYKTAISFFFFFNIFIIKELG